MKYTFDTPEPAQQFLATRGGAGLHHEDHCTHGHPALSLHLISEPKDPRDAPEHLQVLMAQCFAPQLFGSALAFVRAGRGPDAADTFVSEMFTAYEEATKAVLAIQAEGRACCEAAFNTRGREHTCGRNTTPGTTS